VACIKVSEEYLITSVAIIVHTVEKNKFLTNENWHYIKKMFIS